MDADRPRRVGMLRVVGPGILVAATGVGAGDLAGAGFAGAKLGTAVLWGVVVGALFKLLLTEGLARWQLASGQTLLEGVGARLGRWLVALFILLYFSIWSYVVGAAMMSACGVAAQALLPLRTTAGGIFESADDGGRILYGAIHGLIGLALIWIGGFRLFERMMSACIALMFVTVVVTAILIRPDWRGVLQGLVLPRIPQDAEALSWTIALIGGVGGTVTLLSYGYWIRERGRNSPAHLRACRIDLSVGYAMTAIFGIAMVIIASGVIVSQTGVGLIVRLGDRLESEIGPAARWIFLIGAWGAVFSSLLGVWQSVPYLFADCWRIVRSPRSAPASAAAVSTRSAPYRCFLIALAIVPMTRLVIPFAQVQKVYAIVGAAFLPLLALALLLLNMRRNWTGPSALRNRWPSSLALILILLFTLGAGWLTIRREILAPTADTRPGNGEVIDSEATASE